MTETKDNVELETEPVETPEVTPKVNVEFTPEQQAQVDKIIADRLSRVEKKKVDTNEPAKKDDKLTDLEKEIAQLKKDNALKEYKAIMLENDVAPSVIETILKTADLEKLKEINIADLPKKTVETKAPKSADDAKEKAVQEERKTSTLKMLGR